MYKRGIIAIFVFALLFSGSFLVSAAEIADNVPVQIKNIHDKLKNVQFLGQASIK